MIKYSAAMLGLLKVVDTRMPKSLRFSGMGNH